MIVYHASNQIVEKSNVAFCREIRTDFGQAFYTTSHMDQAAKMVRGRLLSGTWKRAYINIYEIDFDKMIKELRVHRFSEADEEWLNYIMTNRIERTKNDYDIVLGPVADSYAKEIYDISEQFSNNELTDDIDDLIERLKPYVYKDQIAFKSNKALNSRYFRFLRATKIELDKGGQIVWR